VPAAEQGDRSAAELLVLGDQVDDAGRDQRAHRVVERANFGGNPEIELARRGAAWRKPTTSEPVTSRPQLDDNYRRAALPPRINRGKPEM
jgi:hypothetical protein